MRDELTLALACLAAVACSAERGRDGGGACPTWRDDVAAELAACSGCHDFTEYPAALAAKDAMVATLDPDAADDLHRPFARTHAVIAAWAACDAPYFDSDVHGGGVHDPASADFHGVEVARLGWDLGACATCHGDDFAGGAAASACTTCHTEGPTACDTCHAATPATGAHAAHVARWSCAECHDVPARWDAPGHVLGDAPPAEARGHDPATGTCAVDCHGEARPRWTGGPAEAACGTCHGAPPPDHAWDRCETCHPADAPHVDRVVQVRTGCDGCHGGGGEAAPPTDLDGDRFTTARGVGAHRSHLEATHGLAAPVACTACHVVPSALGALGHIDTAPPAEVVAAAGWSATTSTCTNACHGAAAPRWTVTGGDEIACGSCHAVPPATAPHDPAQTLDDCAGCHPPLPDRHIDGAIDVL